MVLVARIGTHRAFEPVPVPAGARVFVLTGAGISAESGIKTFRDAGGLWEEHRVEEVASPEGWAADPALVWRFYSIRRGQAETVAPNAAHLALAELETAIGERLFLCTQNVDPLHERAGSRRVVHMHGELAKSRCERDHAPPFEDRAQYMSLEAIPRCGCGGRIRPHICWFGEMPFEMDPIFAALSECDIFVTIGSSGAVYPAAGFAEHARRRGATTIYVGPEEPDNSGAFDECRIGKAGDVVPGLFRALS
jgi:NAD-dependent deacetylase